MLEADIEKQLTQHNWEFAVPYFDNHVFPFDSDLETPAADAALLAKFFTLSSADRLRDSRHVFAYYRDMRDATGGDASYFDAAFGCLDDPAAIWDLVHPKSFFLTRDHQYSYVLLEADCDWEEERGVMLSWRSGTLLVKVGGYDGHPDNQASAGADTSSDSTIIYRGTDPAFTTYRTIAP